MKDKFLRKVLFGRCGGLTGDNGKFVNYTFDEIKGQFRFDDGFFQHLLDRIVKLENELAKKSK